MTLAKPQMRGLLTNTIKKNLIIGTVLSVIAVCGWKYTVEVPRKKKYAEFYKDYDAMAEFERMKALGLFQSCGQEEE
ncbi:cytochrome c oxidase subunit 6C-1-like isoform X2 [Oratosquilla oratoria]